MLLQTSLLALRREGKKSRKGNWWNMGGAIIGDGEGTEEKKGRESVFAQLGVQSNFSAFSAVFAPVVSANCGSRAATLTSGFNF